MVAPMTSASRQTGETLDAKRAVSAAFTCFETLFGTSRDRSAVSLEEVKLFPDRKYWLVTLSYEELRRKPSDMPTLLRVPRQKFKAFKVERQSGRVVSMKMRNGA